VSANVNREIMEFVTLFRDTWARTIIKTSGHHTEWLMFVYGTGIFYSGTMRRFR